MHTTNEDRAPIGRQPLLDKLDEVERALSAQLDSLSVKHESTSGGRTERVGTHLRWAIGSALLGTGTVIAVLKAFGQLR